MNSRIRIASVAALAALAALCAGEPLLAQAGDLVTAAPQIFAPGRISGPANDGAPAFTPDGATLYFERNGGHASFIVESHLVRGAWTEPTIASFSGGWSDLQPTLSPDGAELVFVSTRPTDARDTTHQLGVALWKVTRTPTGWSTPVRLPMTINFCPRVFKPSLSADGTLYFMARPDSTPTWRLYRSRMNHGNYEPPVPLSFSDGTHTDVDPGIAPDQSFLVFSSAGRGPAGDAHEHLYITFRAGETWGPIRPVRYEGDYDKNPADDGEAQLSPDGRTLYFTSGRVTPGHPNRSRQQAEADYARLQSWDNGNNNVWSISLAPWFSK